MGSPKSLLELGRRSLLEKIAAAADEVAGQVVLAGGGPVPAALAGKKRLPDAPGVAGPLAGILAAFRSRPDAAWIVLSCDLPFVSGDALRWLLEQRRPDCLAVIPFLDSPETPEPLLAVYEPSALAPLEEAARRGERSIRRILSREHPRGMESRTP
jgi:molybdopterin-guanine dinucleotide biosynthesis protein A